MISYKKLLPKVMKDTSWGDFIDSYQLIMEQIKEDKIDPIFNQFTKNASIAELKKLAYFLGFRLSSYDGWSSTQEYFRRQIESIPYKIKYKAAKPAYQYSGYVYNLISNIYALAWGLDGRLNTELSTVYDPSGQIQFAVLELDPEGDNLLYYKDENITTDNDTYLDTDFYINATTPIYNYPEKTGLLESSLDSSNFLTLDMSTGTEEGDTAIVVTTTRNLIYYYKHKFIETATEFLSLNSLKALKNDIDQIHKATEVIYYEPVIEIHLNSDKTQNTRELTSFDKTITANQYSILIGEDFDNLAYIHFGTGAQNIPLNSGELSGVQIYSYQYPPIISGVLSGVITNWDTAPSGVVQFDLTINEKNKFTEFTEIAFFDVNSGLIAYSEFPKIQWDPNMYNNINCEITFV